MDPHARSAGNRVLRVRPILAVASSRAHALVIDEFDGTASLETAFRIAPMFGIGEGAARAIAREVGEAVGRWREVPTRLGLTPDEVDRMSSAFEHEDLRALS